MENLKIEYFDCYRDAFPRVNEAYYLWVEDKATRRSLIMYVENFTDWELAYSVKVESEYFRRLLMGRKGVGYAA